MKTPLSLIVLCSLVCSSTTAPSAPADPAVVKIDTGALKGSFDAGVLSWKGIPFAAPPTGELRWRSPQPAAKWQGVRDASAYGNDCMQVPFPSDAAPLGTPPAENCLFANVWRPAGTSRKLPVVFWIYGGGFVNGGASPPTYSGAELAKQGVLFISANYRVGRFGTFAHPALTRANADAGLLGNYGYMDQLAALRWVKRNIESFGGDPGNVTIVGESAGGMSVHVLVTSPLTKGLFSRAVVMSGGDGGGMGAANLASTEQIGIQFAEKFGIARTDTEALRKLRALSADQVTDGLSMMALFGPPGPRTFASPYADGKLAVDVGAAYRANAFPHVPMMIGATSADIGGKNGPMIAGARNIETVIAAKGAPVYAYRFSYVAEKLPPVPAGAPASNGAGHASDIPFFFNTQAIKYQAGTTARDNAMGKAISAYLVNFAKSGNPNGADLPAWPRYERAKDEVMDFSASGKAVPGKDAWGSEMDTAQLILGAMQGGIRTPEERARDVNRLPVEILSFFRLHEDMRVIEVLPAGGWFTKILAPVLKDKGKLYVTHPEGFYANAFQPVKALPGLEKVEEIGWGAAGGGSGGPFGPSGKWNVAPVDLVLTFRNYHNFSPADRATVNKSTFDALKPGGYYGIVDHTRRHNEPGSRENGRRVDPVLLIKEVQDAGFVLADFSNLYYRPNDALSLEVGNPAVNDRTDRIALLFRKP